MGVLFKIRNWEFYYETHETRKLKNLRWIPMPNKHDGLTFKKIVARKDRCEIFTAWILILQIASKCPVRGQLSVDSPGNLPLSPGDMGLKTGFPGEIFQKALNLLSEGNDSWILKENAITGDNPETSGEPPGLAGTSPAVLNGREGIEGREGKGGKDTHLFSSSQFFDITVLDQEFKDWPEDKIKFYWESARDYSDSKGKKYKNWAAAMRTWARRDQAEGKGYFSKNLNNGNLIGKQAEELRSKYGR